METKIKYSVEDYKTKKQEDLYRHNPALILDSTSQVKRYEVVFHNGFFELKQIKNSLAERQTFREILSNAIDNIRRGLFGNIDVGTLEIVLTDELISVSNGGYPPPLGIDPETKKYTPEKIWGVFNTSTNYTGNNDLFIGGMNGIGGKGCCLFSEYFQVKIWSKEEKKCYSQIWREFVPEEPKIREYNGESRVKISYKLNDKLGKPNINWYAYDVACSIISCPKVILKINEEEYIYQNKKLVDFLSFYPEEIKPLFKWYSKGNEVIVADISKDFVFPKVVGWINGIPCSNGTHIEGIKSFFARSFEEKISKVKEYSEKLEKFRTKELPQQIKNNVLFLIKLEGPNPTFGAGQNKGSFNCFRLKTGETNGNPIFEDLKLKFSKSDINENEIKWYNWKNSKLLQLLNEIWNSESEKELIKSDGKKTRFVKIKKLEDANFAGGINAYKASLIICEGDSAMEYEREWISQDPQGRNIWGILPVRGKLINTIKASIEELAENEEIQSLKKALGLQEKTDYTIEENRKTLRYGKVVISTDGDSDGSHIRGLILLYFYSRFSSLIKIGFVHAKFSPAVRVNWKKETLRFYRFESYLTWLEEDEQRKKAKVNYLKGLGSSSAEETIDDYKVNRYVIYQLDIDTDRYIHLAFDDEFSNERKEWLTINQGSKNDFDLSEQNTLPITKFIEDELIIFFHLAIVRAIPRFEDGLKEVQRKLLWSLFDTKNLVKIPTLSATAAKETAYHHGDAISLALVKMTQVFTGSTYNLPFFIGKGKFGSRASGGKSAKFRYIEAKINPITQRIFPKEDFPLLTLRKEEGKEIEPEFMLPILPISLINGASGVASGWKTFIPSYKPKEVIENLKRLLRNEEFEEMIPYYNGYNGNIELIDNGFKTYGILIETGKNWEVKELPLFYWTIDFREELDKLIVEKKIRSYKDLSKPETVDFTISGVNFETFGYNEELETKEEFILRKLGLISTQSMNNMVLRYGKMPKKYQTILEIFNDFIEFRLPFYKKRKDYQLKVLSTETEKIRQQLILFKLHFDKKLNISDENLFEKAFEFDNSLTENIIEEILEKNNLKKIRKEGIEKLEKEMKKLEKERDELQDTKTTLLWINDLEKLEKLI